jgi:hypothetical protein
MELKSLKLAAALDMIALGFFGWIVSRYLGAFQLGYIDYAWDPFFGNSSMEVLNSNMSHSLPISGHWVPLLILLNS